MKAAVEVGIYIVENLSSLVRGGIIYEINHVIE